MSNHTCDSGTKHRDEVVDGLFDTIRKGLEQGEVLSREDIVDAFVHSTGKALSTIELIDALRGLTGEEASAEESFERIHTVLTHSFEAAFEVGRRWATEGSDHPAAKATARVAKERTGAVA